MIQKISHKWFLAFQLHSKAQAQVGYNDDLVMSFAIALWLRDTSLKLRQQGIALNKRALSQFQKTDTTLYTNKDQRPDTFWDWNNGQDNENLTWLL